MKIYLIEQYDGFVDKAYIADEAYLTETEAKKMCDKLNRRIKRSKDIYLKDIIYTIKSVNVKSDIDERLIAKKYKKKTDTDGRLIFVCPECGNILAKFWSDIETVSCRPYCYQCGQKLDWGLQECK